MSQLDLFSDPYGVHGYDKILVAFSGGKDSIACVLHLLELGIPKSRIELHHHLVDGRGSWVDAFGVQHDHRYLMDWPITESYCQAFADAMGLPIYFSWKQGGFEGEMTRDGVLTQPICWENPDGSISSVGGERGKMGTRMKFPQVSPDLSVRWCSAYLKIDVLARLIANSQRFWGKRILVVTGERGEESKARSCYPIHEPDRADNRKGRDKRKRLVDHLRPIRDWKEDAVWAIIERYGVRAHPCYFLGWGRCSCIRCIFGNANQFASGKVVDPLGFEIVAAYEDMFRVTIKRNESLRQLVEKGIAYKEANNPQLIALAMSEDYSLEILMGDQWILPAGAFGELVGPS